MITSLTCLIILSVALSNTSVSCKSETSTSSPYDEVPLNHWSYAAMEYIKQEGIIDEYPMEFSGRTEPLQRYEMTQGVIRFLNELAYKEEPIPIHIQLIAMALRCEYWDQLSKTTGIALWPGKVTSDCKEVLRN